LAEGGFAGGVVVAGVEAVETVEAGLLLGEEGEEVGGLEESARSAGAMTGEWISGVKRRPTKKLSLGMSFSKEGRLMLTSGGVRGE
jgi:hypothetical protein